MSETGDGMSSDPPRSVQAPLRVPVPLNPAQAKEPLLVAADISKSFPGVHAVRNVTFELRVGEVHGLVGANGAGKSTFIRILAGAIQPDSGNITLAGWPLVIGSPREGRSSGISAIYQELTLIPEMSALSNVFVGNLLRKGPFLDVGAMRRRFDELVARMELSILASAKASSLSIANQQMIEIMRALQAKNSVLIMDEPTAPLGPPERRRLYDLIAQLKTENTSIIFISHDLDEVLNVCDRVSIMRDGRMVDTRSADKWSKASLVGAMLGEVEIFSGTRSLTKNAEEVLQVKKVSIPKRLFDVGFSLHRGEILGIAGLVGSGRTELLHALAGADATATGRMVIDGAERPLPRSIREAVGLGIALVPEDRKTQGLVLSRTALSNIMLPGLSSVATGSVINGGALRRRATELARQIGFDPARLVSMAGTLSGGNQQKLVIGKWLQRQPRILLLDEPSRGIDVGAKQEIFRTIRRLADAGAAVILVSSDLEEVVDHADNILVISRGHVVGAFSHAEASVKRILNLIFAVEKASGRD